MTRRLLAAIVLAVLLPGCQDPYQQDQAQQTPAGAAAEERARREQAHGDELAPRARVRDTAPPSARGLPRSSPRAAVRAFCAQWANWDWRTLARQQRRLARLSVGRLRREYLAAAQTAARDERLVADRVAVRGQVVGVDVTGSGPERAGVCVALEEQLENGRAELSGGRHNVYLARLRRAAHGGWWVSRWEPQP